MFKRIGAKKMNLPIYNNDEYFFSINELTKHVNNKENFSSKSHNVGIGITITENLNKKNYRHAYYKDCLFKEVSCNSIGFAGSKFINTTFLMCDFENGNLHSCDFSDVTFEGYQGQQFKMANTGFHKSTFTNCTFRNLHIFSCGFTDTIFYNTTFENCTIRLCSLENAQFKKCNFIDTNLSTLNLEYTEFSAIKAHQTTFPFISTPAAYGLLKELSNIDDDNAIYSADAPEHKLTVTEYLNLMKHFEYFYYENRNYYALANVYISQNKTKESYEVIKMGILNAIQTRDFRMLRYFCKLVYLADIFSVLQRRTLFENISKWVDNENLSLAEYHNYQLFSGSIREMLLNNNYRRPTLYFYLETNIEPNEQQKQAVLLTTIDQILAYCKVPSSSIELRHNSAYVDFLTVICDSFAQLSQVLIMIYGSLAGVALFATGIKKIVDSTQSMIANCDQHNLSKLEQEKMKLEIDALKKEQEYKQKMDDVEYQKSVYELTKLSLEIENLEKEVGNYKDILLENGIKISVHHTTKNLDYAPLHEIMHYNG